MDWDTAMQGMIAAEVQKQLAPIERDIHDLQSVNNDLVATLKAGEGALKLCSDNIVLLTKRAENADKRMNKIANDSEDLWQALGVTDNIQPSVENRLGCVSTTLADIHKRIAALEYVRVPVSEIEPQELDEAMRERVQPLRDDLDDLEGKVKQFIDTTDDRLSALEAESEFLTQQPIQEPYEPARDIVGSYPLESSTSEARIARLELVLNEEIRGRLATTRGTNRHLNSFEANADARLSALEGRGAPEEPAKAPETIENICAALGAEYVRHATSLMASGMSASRAMGRAQEHCAKHFWRAMSLAGETITKLAESIGEADAA